MCLEGVPGGLEMEETTPANQDRQQNIDKKQKDHNAMTFYRYKMELKRL